MISPSDTRRASQIRTYDRGESAVFLKTTEEFGGLSNMAGGFPLVVNGIHILTSEALYQACRFPHMPDIQRLIIAQASPMTAKMKSKPYRRDSRPDWNQARVKIMRWCLRVKLAQNWTKFSELLLATENLPIVESSRKDDFWGAKPVDDRTLVGMNVLGRLLMELREEVKRGVFTAPMRVEPLTIPNFLLYGQPIQLVIDRSEDETRRSVQKPERRIMASEASGMTMQVSLFDRQLASMPGGQQLKDKGQALSQRLKPYPAYKDSGVRWLGQVPEHWEVRRLKQICRLFYGDALPTEARQEGAVPVFGSNGRVGSHSFSNTKAPCIIVGRKGSFGKVNFSTEPVYAIDTTFFVDDRSTTTDVRWLFYLLRSMGLDEVSKDSAVPGLDREDVYQRVAATPSLPEQLAIVRFLDHVDRRIRRYIWAKKKLIALLNEQKLAIIHRAVTRGLDPNVRLKPSGVEWLREVPEHWAISRLKFVASHIVDCLHATPQYIADGEYPAIRTADIEPGRINLATARRVNREQYELWTSRMTPAAGDILYSREGERFGLAALVPEGVSLCISQRMMVFRIRPAQRSDFIMWQLNSGHVYAQAAADVIGATAPHVNVERIKNYWIVSPPLEEQEVLAAMLAAEDHTVQKVIEQIERELALIREYRTRLISDVVTGKLEVREVAARLPDEAEEPEPLAEGEAMAHDEEEGEGADLDALSEEAVA